MLMRALIATALAIGALAAPAAAEPTLDPLKPCYASDGRAPEKRETINVHATGFTPAAIVDLQIDGPPTLFTGQVDAFGNVRAAVPAPFQGRGERPFTLVVTERGNPANFVSDTPLVTNLGVTLRPNPAKPSQKVRFRGRGFTKAGSPVFAHYVFGGVLQKTVRLVKQAVSPCGVFSVRHRQIPVRNARVGDWLLQIDQQRRWANPPASNMQAMTIKVRETFLQP